MVETPVSQPTGYQYGSGYGVDAVLYTVDDDDRPFCSHGPALLFERFFKDKESRRFFACSASRDRKECSFFQWQDEKPTSGKELVQAEIKKKIFKKKKAVIQLQEGDNWCFDCSCGYTSENTAHQSHTTKMLSGNDVKFPTQFLNPSESKKAKAQYFFNEDTCHFFLTTIKRMQYKTILCIGTPRLYELLIEAGFSAILMDIDTRFEYFYSPQDFLPYNLYTHFFFDKGQRQKTFELFTSTCSPEDTLLILDPPFGGLLNVLEKTLSKIWSLFAVESIPTMMVFPYFLENHVSQNLPLLLMHDYKVSYSNHPTYHNNGKQPRGSPVRLYTNVPGDKLSMPKEEYKFCKICQRYVYKENWHCTKCNACTSKDGRRYVHCTECNKCVKPGDVHCTTCNCCKPVKHTCASGNTPGCHICGEFDHKRRDCPKKQEKKVYLAVGKKRKVLMKKSSRKVAAKKKKNTGL